MKFEEALEINDSYILVEEIGDDYVHNTNGKGFFNILKTGKLEGKVQKDKVTPHPKDKELCMSRSDMKPQHTGYSPSQYLKFGTMIKISLKMDNIRNDLKLKKPYPVSYGYFNKMRSLKYELQKYKKDIKTEEGINIYKDLMKQLSDSKTYSRVANCSPARKSSFDNIETTLHTIWFDWYCNNLNKKTNIKAQGIIWFEHCLLPLGSVKKVIRLDDLYEELTNDSEYCEGSGCPSNHQGI